VPFSFPVDKTGKLRKPSASAVPSNESGQIRPTRSYPIEKRDFSSLLPSQSLRDPRLNNAVLPSPRLAFTSA
jgi:hypothetical protein